MNLHIKGQSICEISTFNRLPSFLMQNSDCFVYMSLQSLCIMRYLRPGEASSPINTCEALEASSDIQNKPPFSFINDYCALWHNP
jgi:hypothetical protein